MPPLTIVFDLDGTLVDTAPDLIASLNVILARHDVPAQDALAPLIALARTLARIEHHTGMAQPSVMT